MAVPGKIAMIMAAGHGLRMGGKLPKQFLRLKGIPLLSYSINTFLRTFGDISVILVLPPEHLHQMEAISQTLERPKDVQVVAGGRTRFHSVQKGLARINSPSVVFIHDGARPLVSGELIRRCYDQTLMKGSAIPVIAIPGSLRKIGGEGSHSVDREQYRLTQTPQTFKSEIIIPAFSQQYTPIFTDEASVVENSGTPVFLIQGEARNIKITHPEDLLIAERLMSTGL